MTSLKLVSLNIEHSKHLDLVIPFLKQVNPDVVCLQEVVENDLPRFEKELGMQTHFGPQVLWAEKEGDEPVVAGEAILSRLGFLSKELKYYGGTQPGVQAFDRKDKEGSNERIPKVLVIAEVEKDGITFRFATTHFTWTPGGDVSDIQRRELPIMLEKLEAFPAMVLTGDFNAPRGGEIFTEIARRYTDNIPLEYEWSVDGDLHRVGWDKLRADAAAVGFSGLMVDGLFTTPEYTASDVELIGGVSDHMAVVAMVSRVK